MKEGKVSYKVTKNVGIIEFYHPAHNALPSEVLDQLARTIDEAGDDPEARVIVLQSAGDRTFCAGASFDELVAIENETTGKAFFMGFAKVINACRKCPKLIIGRVQGKAVGGGVGVASAVDYCIASKFASIKLSELAIGIGPFVVGPAVERKIGTSAFSQLSINAKEWRTATWAQEKGLFYEVFDNNKQVDQYVMHLADTLAEMNPEAMTALKKTIWSGTDHWDDLLEERAAMSGRLVLSDFTRDAIASFKSKS
jgi:methylglutaconyl-CoA hydratase